MYLPLFRIGAEQRRKSANSSRKDASSTRAQQINLGSAEGGTTIASREKSQLEDSEAFTEKNSTISITNEKYESISKSDGNILSNIQLSSGKVMNAVEADNFKVEATEPTNMATDVMYETTFKPNFKTNRNYTSRQLSEDKKVLNISNMSKGRNSVSKSTTGQKKLGNRLQKQMRTDENIQNVAFMKDLPDTTDKGNKELENSLERKLFANSLDTENVATRTSNRLAKSVSNRKSEELLNPTRNLLNTGAGKPKVSYEITDNANQGTSDSMNGIYYLENNNQGSNTFMLTGNIEELAMDTKNTKMQTYKPVNRDPWVLLNDRWNRIPDLLFGTHFSHRAMTKNDESDHTQHLISDESTENFITDESSMSELTSGISNLNNYWENKIQLNKKNVNSSKLKKQKNSSMVESSHLSNNSEVSKEKNISFFYQPNNNTKHRKPKQTHHEPSAHESSLKRSSGDDPESLNGQKMQADDSSLFPGGVKKDLAALSRNISAVLENLLKDYNNKIRPGYKNGKLNIIYIFITYISY